MLMTNGATTFQVGGFWPSSVVVILLPLYVCLPSGRFLVGGIVAVSLRLFGGWGGGVARQGVARQGIWSRRFLLCGVYLFIRQLFRVA